MPDDLDRAVDARIDAYRPDATPPFAAIEALKRGRDRRRRGVGGVVAGVALVGAASLAVPPLTGGGDRLTEQAADRPPAGAGTALVVHNTADGEAARSADASVRACLQRPGVSSRTVDAAQPAAYVVTADAAERLSQVEACVAAVPGVLAERETEALAGRGPVPLATMPGGGAVYGDDSQQVLADRLVDRLRGLVSAALPGEVEEGSGQYATTRTPTGPSRNVGGSVQWHDERGYVSVVATRMERLDEPRADACAAGPSAPELECARVTPTGGGPEVTVFTWNETGRVRHAVYALGDGSGVIVMQQPLSLDLVAQATPAAANAPLRRVPPRADLPLSDSELAAIAVALAG